MSGLLHVFHSGAKDHGSGVVCWLHSYRIHKMRRVHHRSFGVEFGTAYAGIQTDLYLTLTRTVSYRVCHRRVFSRKRDILMKAILPCE